MLTEMVIEPASRKHRLVLRDVRLNEILFLCRSAGGV